MNSWVSDRINEWLTWRHQLDSRYGIIPPKIQVGKILEQFDGNLDQSVMFVKRMINADSKSAFFRHNGYWLEVKDILVDYQARCIIEG